MARLAIIESMTKTSEKRVVTADEIAEMADAGMDISRFFTGFGRMMSPFMRSAPASDQPVEIAVPHSRAEKSA